jgi:hypothetical protein
MKKLISLAGLILISLAVIAQSDNDYLEIARDVLKTEKKAAIAEVMELTDAESQPFWNLYNEYQSKLYTIQNKRIAVIIDFADHYDNMTDEKADELWKNAMDFQAELIKLKKSYYKKFKKILPASKAARFFQAENKIETLINFELAIELPLLENR